MTVTPADMEKARQLIPCDPAACPFGWNSCRRNAACELRGEVAAALSQARDEGLEMAAKWHDESAEFFQRVAMGDANIGAAREAVQHRLHSKAVRTIKSGEAGRG